MNETKEELLALGIVEMRKRFESTARELIVPFELDLVLEGVTLTVPQRGDKKKLLELSEMNGKQFKIDKLNIFEKTGRKAGPFRPDRIPCGNPSC